MENELNKKLKEKVAKYEKLTEEALGKVEIAAGLEDKERGIAEDFLQMAHSYFGDAQHFREKGEMLDALAAFSYAHAWLDAGVRAGVLDAKGDSRLFTLP